MLIRVAPLDFSAEGIGLAGMVGGHTSLHVIHTMELSSLWHLGEEGSGLSLNLSLGLRCKMRVLPGWP